MSQDLLFDFFWMRTDILFKITTSYGEDEQVIPETYTKAVCDMLGQLGARGVSIIFSSGDSGRKYFFSYETSTPPY